MADSAVLDRAQRERLLRVLASRVTTGGDLVLDCDTHRSQHRNREEVTRRLVALVRKALIPPRPRRPTRPTAAARARRLADKRRRAQLKRQRGRVRRDDETS